jgi:hypothetical protein
MMGAPMADTISQMATKAAMEPSSDMIKRAMGILDDARKRDQKVAPIVSQAMDMLRNGPEAETRDNKPNTSFRPATSKGLY